MVGRFNSPLQWTQNRGKLIVAGTLEGCAPGAEVRIDVTSLVQNGRRVSCNDEFTIPPSGPLQWAMEVSAPFVAGVASGAATATDRRNPSESFSWSQPSIQIS